MKYVEGAKKLFMSTGTTFPKEIIWSVALIKQLSAGANHSLGKLDAETCRGDRRGLRRGDGGKARRQDNRRRLPDGLRDRDQHERQRGHRREGVGDSRGGRSTPTTKSTWASPPTTWCRPRSESRPYSSRSRVLLPSLAETSKSLGSLAARTSSVYKSGRTHLRDALPVTMGQEFGAYADAFAHDRRLVFDALEVRQGAPHRRDGGGDGDQHEPRLRDASSSGGSTGPRGSGSQRRATGSGR